MFVFAFFYATAKENQSITFIENKGQVTDQFLQPRSDIDFKISQPGINVFIGPGHIHYQWCKPGIDASHFSFYRMDVALIDANKYSIVRAEEKQSYHEQYYTPPAGLDGIHAGSFRKITYFNIYPGIDWVLLIKDNSLEHEFVVHEGANPGLIKIKYSGASSLAINTDGSLTALTPSGLVNEHKPISYQENGEEVPTQFLLNENVLSYELASYSGKLVIDPTLVWGTYYGETGQDAAVGISTDINRDVYFAGSTQSLNNIATIGSHQYTHAGGNHDCYVAKFDSLGNRLWATYYGGSANDLAYAVTCDPVGNVYLSGATESSTNIATSGAHQPALASTQNAFLAKFNSDGTRLWATYYGGFGYASGGQPVACDDSGNVFLAGGTSSDYNIATPGSFKDTLSTSNLFITVDGYLVKFDSNGARQWSTYYGDTSSDWIHTITTDPDGNIYIAGETDNINSIATNNAHQPTFGGATDGFIAKFNLNGERIWGTYYGGTGMEDIESIDYSDGNLYVMGFSESTGNIATTNSYQPALSGTGDAMLVKFDTSGMRIWGTYFGGSSWESLSYRGNMLSCDNNGNCYMTGLTASTTGIAFPGAHQSKFGGGLQDAFVVKFDFSGFPLWSTYYGGCGIESAVVCATDNNGNVYVAGGSASDNEITTPGSFMSTFIPPHRAYLSRFNDIPKQQDTIAGDTSLCDGDIATFIASPVFGANSYTWILPGGWTGSSTTNSITTNVTTPGGDIMVIAHRECLNDTLPLLHIAVHPLPQPVVTQNFLTLSTTAYAAYQWYFNNTVITGATGQNHTATQDGDYYVIVTDTNGCSDTSNITTVSNVSVAGISGEYPEIKIYPNPAINALTIEGEIINATIFSCEGREMATCRNFKKQVVDISGYAAGIYFIRLETHTGTQTLRFTKTH